MLAPELSHVARGLREGTRFKRIHCGCGQRYPLLVVDERGFPQPAVTEWYRLRAAQRAPSGTTETYLGHILALLSYFADQGIRWNDSPAVVRAGFVSYLRDRLHCQVEPDRLDGVRYSLTRDTPISASTLNVLRSALQDFYRMMADPRVQLYRYDNPFTSQLLRRLNEVRVQAHMTGDITGDVWRDDGFSGHTPQCLAPQSPMRARSRRQPSAFVRAKRVQEWAVDVRLATPDVLDAFFAVVEAVVAARGVSARDKAILLLLRYTGARVFEILSLTVGGYRAEGVAGRIRVTNKGEQGRLTKTLYFEAAPQVDALLRRYLERERPRRDALGRVTLSSISDEEPFFLTRQGTPYTYDAFYANWRRFSPAYLHLCPIAFSLHDIRHAFVTEHLLRLRQEQAVRGYDDAWRAVHKAAFAHNIMGWRDPATIEVYDHSLDTLDVLGRLAAQQQGQPVSVAVLAPAVGAGRSTSTALTTVPTLPVSDYDQASTAWMTHLAGQREHPRHE